MSTSAISHPVHGLRTPDWLALRLQTNETAGASLTAILRSWDGIEKQVFALRGMAMLLVEERELYRWVVDDEVGDYYQSFDRWMKQELPNSWGYCRDALRAVKELKGMPFEDLLQIKRCNLEQLKKVSSSVRLLPEVVAAAKQLPEKQFVEKLNKEHAQHLETSTPVVMAPGPDAEKFEHCVEMVMAVEECGRGQALAKIAELIEQEYLVPFEHLKAETA